MMDVDPNVISFNVILGVLLVDILLSGDNAIVIALVCRSLPKSAQFRVMWLGILGAFLARVLLTGVATMAMQLPFLKLIGGLLLLKISVGLIVDNIKSEPGEGGLELEPQQTVWAAAKTIILADLVMSLDNVLALSAVTHNNFEMLTLGLLLSIPILMFGSIYIAKLIDMFPLFLWLGAAVLGGVSGGLLIDDPIFDGLFSADATLSHFVIPVLAAGCVVQISRIILANRTAVQGLKKPPPLFGILRGQVVDAPLRARDLELSTAAANGVMSGPSAVQSAAALRGATAAVRIAIPDIPEAVTEGASDAAPDGAPDVVVRQPRDYRVLVALGLFMVVAGWITYAMVNSDPPAVPARFVAYRCTNPLLVVQYRPSAAQIRFSAGKGSMEAKLVGTRIAWDDYPQAVQTLNMQPPLRVMAVQDDQIVLDGGAFAQTVCASAR